MNAKQYIGHSLRYFLKLLLLLVIIYGLLFITGYAKVSAEFFLREMFTSKSGLFLFIALAILAGVYPLFGFVKREITAGIESDREKIINAFISEGYSMRSDADGKMVFRMSSPFRKLWMMFDDKIILTANGDESIVIEGIRKQTVQVQFRIETYMRNSQ